MSHRASKAIKVCNFCGAGYDAFRALDARGRYCSPLCLTSARERRRSKPLGLVALTPDFVDAVAEVVSA